MGARKRDDSVYCCRCGWLIAFEVSYDVPMHRTPRTQLAKLWINKHFTHHYKYGPEKVIELGRCAIIRRLNELMHNTDPGPGLVGNGKRMRGLSTCCGIHSPAEDFERFRIYGLASLIFIPGLRSGSKQTLDLLVVGCASFQVFSN